jgi:hypothetical protein
MNKMVCLIMNFIFLMNKNSILLKKLHQIHAEIPNHDSYLEASFPFITNPDGFDTYLNMNIKQPVVRTNLSFSPFIQADEVDVRKPIFD